MRLYLTQHGHAMSKEENPDRPLNELGRKDVARMASFLARSRVSVGRVLHSGKLRAQETALILSDVIGPGRLVEQSVYDISPNADTTPFCDALKGEYRRANDVMVVGHLPYMGRLVARLVTGNEAEKCVLFEPGTVVCLEPDEETSSWVIQWVVRPSLLGG